jgi:DNA adenine methylase
VGSLIAGHNFTSPLRYPGGKGAIADYVKKILEENDLVDGDYVEAYAGGAGIAWPLLFEEYVRRVHINDLSRSVYAFWESVLTQTEKLCAMIRDAEVTMEEWRRQKAVQRDQQNHTELELAFSTFFLNRTNRSGILGAGVIGGQNQNGTWKLDARFNKADLVRRVQRIALYSSRIRIHNLDAAHFLQNEVPRLPAKTLVYLDPPYYVKGQELYDNHYGHEDHAAIANMLFHDLKHPWIVSYDSAPEIIELYSGYKSIRYDLSYSAQARYSGSEVMFFARTLKIPLVSHPARANEARVRRARTLK